VPRLSEFAGRNGVALVGKSKSSMIDSQSEPAPLIWPTFQASHFENNRRLLKQKSLWDLRGWRQLS